jgi:hypothetical protein
MGIVDGYKWYRMGDRNCGRSGTFRFARTISLEYADFLWSGFQGLISRIPSDGD